MSLGPGILPWVPDNSWIMSLVHVTTVGFLLDYYEHFLSAINHND